MKILFFMLLLFSTQVFSKTTKEVEAAEVECLRLYGTFDKALCLDKILLSLTKENNGMWEVKSAEYKAKLEAEKAKEERRRGVNYHSVCGPFPEDTIKDPKTSKETRKFIEDRIKNCNETMGKAVFGASEVDFCTKANQDDMPSRRICMMAVANKLYSFKDLHECYYDTYVGPSFECIERRDEQKKIALVGYGYPACEFVIGQYVTCPEGKYTFVAAPGKAEITDTKREASQKVVPGENGSVAPASKIGDK